MSRLPKLEGLPDSVTLSGEGEIAFTPRELRQIREACGRSWSQVMADQETDEKFTVMAWLRLRREGHQLSFEEMEDIVIRVVAEEEPADPTSGGSLTSSPPSAASGA